MYYSIVSNKELFCRFTIKESDHYALISFEEKDKQAIFDLLRQQFFQEHPQYPSDDDIISQFNVGVLDEDGTLYYADLKSGSFIRQGSMKLSSFFGQLSKLDAAHAAIAQKRRDIQETYHENTLLRRRSLIPGYKKFCYFDAEYGIKIPFRLKAGDSERKKPLLVYLHGAGVWYSLYNCPNFYAAGVPLMGYMPDAYSSVFRKENFSGARIYAGTPKTTSSSRRTATSIYIIRSKTFAR